MPLNNFCFIVIIMKVLVTKKTLALLENPTYFEVLLCIISGKNYATTIARHLGKTQPTVTGQLSLLEKEGIIVLKKRGKAKEYEVNWKLLLEIFYDITSEIIKGREDSLTKEEKEKLQKVKLREIIPPIFFREFLKGYFSASELAAKRKGYDEIIFSFFSALNNLDANYRKKLVKKFNIDDTALKIISNLMEFEVNGVEQTTIIKSLDATSKNS